MSDLTDDERFQEGLVMGPHGRAVRVTGIAIGTWALLLIALAAYCAVAG